MDIYVSYDSFDNFTSSFAELLRQNNAEVVVRPRLTNPYSSYTQTHGIARVYTVQMPTFSFDIVQSLENDPTYPLVYFHSTAVINYLTHDHLSIAYPRHTLAMRSICNPTQQLAEAHSARITRLMWKYGFRGFDVRISAAAFTRPTTLELCKPPLNAPLGANACRCRSFVDRSAFVLPFDERWGESKERYGDRDSEMKWWMTGTCCDRRSRETTARHQLIVLSSTRNF